MRALLPALLVVAATAQAHAQASATVGSLRGRVVDTADGKPAGGVTIVVKSPAQQVDQVAIADASGLYFVTALPPGMYTLTVFYGASSFTRNGVLVQIGKEAVVNLAVDSRAHGETVVIRGTPPLLDQGSTIVDLTLTEDYTRNIPTGRTVGGALLGAPGAQQDFFGVSFGGSTSVENSYVIDGIDTTDTAKGQLIADMPNEFVQETEIITGGYNAEFGRATGGIVNVVTKSGGDEIHGSVFANYTPGALISAAKVVQHEGGSIDTSLGTDYLVDAGAEVGGAIIPHRLWFHVGFEPSVAHRTLTRLVQTQTDKNGDGVPDVDADGQIHHELVDRTDIPSNLTTYYFTAKLTGVVDKNNQGFISLLGNPRSGDDFVSQQDSVSARDANLFDRADGAIDGIAKWTSKLDDGATQIDAIAGYHHGYSRFDPHGALAGQAQTIYGYERSLDDFADLEGPTAIAACNDNAPTDPYPKIRNCPVTNYNDGGAGLLEHRVNDRYSAAASITQRVTALGHHVLKAGIDAEIATYDSHQEITGGELLTRFCNTDPVTGQCSDAPVGASGSLPGPWEIISFDHTVPGADPTGTLAPGQVVCANGLAVCAASATQIANTRDRNLSAYAQDSWLVVPSLVVDYGVRFEQQQASVASQIAGTVAPTGETIPSTGLTLDNWAPRIGVIWDPTQQGKAKVFGHYGRYYEDVPLDLNVRSLGGEIDNVGLLNASQLPPGSPGFNPACNVDHAPGKSAAQTLAGCTDFQQLAILGGGTEFVAPNLGGQYIDEVVAGVQYELWQDIAGGVSYTHRQVGQIIEDVLTPDGEFFIVNPGRDYASEAADLDAQAAAAKPKDPDRANLLLYRADQLRRIKSFDPPSRDYDALTFTLNKRPTAHSLINASYTYSKERGNYPGLFSTETNQLDPNNSSQYDLPALLANRYGLLGLDRTHVLKLEGFYQLDLHASGFVVAGASVRAQSGIPQDTLGRDPVYGQGEAYLLPRGSLDRVSMTSQLDLLVQYGRSLGRGMTAIAYVDVFNVFDQQDTLVTDENYTFDAAVPIVGGDANDLRHLKAVDDAGNPTPSTVHVNPNFGHSVLNTAPRSVRFGFRVLF